MQFHLWTQKLKQLVGLLAPKDKSQRDVATMERVIYNACQEALLLQSPFGMVMRGPTAPPEAGKYQLPAALPPWRHVDMAKLPDFWLGKRRLTVSTSQVCRAGATLLDVWM